MVSIGKIVERPTAVNKEVEVRPMVFVNFTIDHRFIDGGRCKLINKMVYEAFENPERYSNNYAKQELSIN
jgi:pyruvate/2-oxoglutarate dehydrogenase complex dihydrolipoamide acyltransferase (E2) component